MRFLKKKKTAIVAVYELYKAKKKWKKTIINRMRDFNEIYHVEWNSERVEELTVRMMGIDNRNGGRMLNNVMHCNKVTFRRGEAMSVNMRSYVLLSILASA